MNSRIEEVFNSAPERMKSMLRSVHDFNREYLESKGDINYFARILESMAKVDRDYFVDDSFKENSARVYFDTALSIGHGQTISQPSTVARMLILLDLKKNDNVLEVGTGSGWNASLIAYLVSSGKVVTVEIISEILEKAKYNVRKCGDFLQGNNEKSLKNIDFKLGNVFDIISNRYDKIIFTAGIKKGKEKKIEMLGKYLNSEGKIICPYREGPISVYEMKEGKLNKKLTRDNYRFVPLS